MAIQCSVKIAGDYALVQANLSKIPFLRFDLSKACCRCYENSREQTREYLEEIIRLCGERPQNLELVSRSLMMDLFARRRQMGLLA